MAWTATYAPLPPTAAGSLDPERALGVLARYLGPRDPRMERFRALTA